MNKSAPMEYEKAIEYIDQMIRDGELVTGSRLPTERTISEHLGIGRNSTREALSILHGMGMIRRVQGSGNYVTGDAHRAIRQICTMMLALGTITKKDVCEFRRVLEKSACLLLSERVFLQTSADSLRKYLQLWNRQTKKHCRHWIVTFTQCCCGQQGILSWSPSWMPSQRFIRNGSTS